MSDAKPLTKIKFSIITVSDRCSAGQAEDKSGPLLTELCVGSTRYDGSLVSTTLVPDDYETIREHLMQACDMADVVITTGGTGLAPRDVTPEATASVIERRCNGIEVALLQHSLGCTPLAALSRPCVGTRKQTLIVNFPGKPKACQENFEVLEPLLAHAVMHLRDQVSLAHAS